MDSANIFAFQCISLFKSLYLMRRGTQFYFVSPPPLQSSIRKYCTQVLYRDFVGGFYTEISGHIQIEIYLCVCY